MRSGGQMRKEVSRMIARIHPCTHDVQIKSKKKKRRTAAASVFSLRRRFKTSRSHLACVVRLLGSKNEVGVWWRFGGSPPSTLFVLLDRSFFFSPVLFIYLKSLGSQGRGRAGSQAAEVCFLVQHLSSHVHIVDKDVSCNVQAQRVGSLTAKSKVNNESSSEVRSSALRT